MQELQKTPTITENCTLDNKIQYAKPQNRWQAEKQKVINQE